MSLTYRADIDGLRAVAVISVILFHAGFELFGGGYVGVDVFFVISGYLITSIIVDDIREGRFSLIAFYERRARRILPALFFVAFCCLPFAWIWLDPRGLKDFAQSLFAVATFSSNILFYMESGYFDTTTELKPLLHTWSLAVEEQFYILFPLLLLITWRIGRKAVLATTVSLFVLSLGLAHWGSNTLPAAAFFLLPGRIWELLLGAFCAFYLSQKKPASYGSFNQITNTQRDQAASALGLLLIGIAVFGFDEHTPTPGLYTLLPTVGTALLILFCTQGTLIGRILGSRPMVGVGLISYSAYLWHQPLFAFARHGYGIQIVGYEPIIFALLSAVTLLLAWASWTYIEKPFRNTSIYSSKQILTISLAATVTLAALGWLGHINKGFRDYYYAHRVVPEASEMLRWLDYKSTDEFTVNSAYGKCLYGAAHVGFATFDKEACLKLDKEKTNILLMGDSHAAHFAHALKQSLPAMNVMQATASGCRPLLPADGKQGCIELINFIFDEFLIHNNVDAIVLSGRWQESDLTRFAPTIDYLSARVSRVIVFGPTMEYTHDVPLLISKAMTGNSAPDIPDYFRIESRYRTDQAMKEIIKNTGLASYKSVTDILCPERRCITYLDEQTPIAWDTDHFTPMGARYVIERMDLRELDEL